MSVNSQPPETPSWVGTRAEKAIIAKMAPANVKRAAILRACGFVVLTPEQVGRGWTCRDPNGKFGNPHNES